MEQPINNQQRKIQGAVNPALIKDKNALYSKKYYIMFFSIMVSTFLLLLWLCNATRLKEIFQIITLTALSIAIAEYSTRRYLRK